MDNTVDQNVKENIADRQDAVRSWAQRRNEQLKLSQQNPTGELSLYQKLMHAPKNIWSELTTDIAENKDLDYKFKVRDYAEDPRWNVYEAMMKASQQKQKPSPNVQRQWEMLLNRGSID